MGLPLTPSGASFSMASANCGSPSMATSRIAGSRGESRWSCPSAWSANYRC